MSLQSILKDGISELFKVQTRTFRPQIYCLIEMFHHLKQDDKPPVADIGDVKFDLRIRKNEDGKIHCYSSLLGYSIIKPPKDDRNIGSYVNLIFRDHCKSSSLDNVVKSPAKLLETARVSEETLSNAIKQAKNVREKLYRAVEYAYAMQILSLQLHIYSEGAKDSNKEKRFHYPAEAIQMFDNKSPQLYANSSVSKNTNGSVIYGASKSFVNPLYPDVDYMLFIEAREEVTVYLVGTKKGKTAESSEIFDIRKFQQKSNGFCTIPLTGILLDHLHASYFNPTELFTAIRDFTKISYFAIEQRQGRVYRVLRE